MMENKEIQYLFKVLADPSLMQTEEFESWIRDKAHYELFWNTKAAWDVFLLNDGGLPDLETEWSRFKRLAQMSGPDENPVSGRKVRLGRFFRWSAAAVFLTAIGCGIYFYAVSLSISKPLTLVQALPCPQNVEMINQSGDTLLLNRKDTIYAAVGKKPEKMEYNTIRTPRGKDFKITLCDGTEILLNSESSLRYPLRFDGEQRVVELSGEAYFKVSKNSKKPFVVQTDYLQAKVLGTGFNVRAFSPSDLHVTLIEGSVAVRRNDTDSPLLLHPGEDVSLTGESGSLKVQMVDVRKYTAWTNGFFFFEDESLENIMRELGKWYNVNVVFSDTGGMDYHFHFWVDRNRDIQEALDLLREMNKVNISYEDNTITIF